MEEENFELVSAMSRRGSKNHYMITIYALLLSIRTVEISNFAD